MVTEIGARNLGDTFRYNMLPVGYFSFSRQNNYLRQCIGDPGLTPL
jgi:nitric oxide synthase oxygenase domain/subunit